MAIIRRTSEKDEKRKNVRQKEKGVWPDAGQNR